MPYRYVNQVRTVILIELALVAFGVVVAVQFWGSVCQESVVGCVRNNEITLWGFLFISLFRPFVFTPAAVFILMSGSHFGPLEGTFVGAASALLSTLTLYLLAKALGKRLVSPWLRSNLPKTYQFVRSQDWKIVLASRLLPVLPFDLLTFLYGAFDFRFKSVMVFTFLGVLPEAAIFAFMADPATSVADSVLMTALVLGVVLVIPGMVIEFRARKSGGGLWGRLKDMWAEIHDEMKMNNEIIKRDSYDPQKIPILLLYGFFASRRSLTALERILTSRGYEVISFNLGGLFGVFFTRSILETAEYIDYKLKRQFERHGFDKIQVVAHSKGGFVALWWLLRLGGSRFCKRVVTLGTPYAGSSLTWLALVTPLGLIFRDTWQMRPGSNFLKALHESKIPKDVEIYNLYSNRDRVATGRGGTYKLKGEDSKRVFPIPMHHVSHFEFLYRRDVGDSLARILGSPWKKDHSWACNQKPLNVDTKIDISESSDKSEAEQQLAGADDATLSKSDNDR